MFQKKVAKAMQNGMPKVIQIHEQFVIGRPRADIFGSRGRFLRGRKIIVCLIAAGEAKNR